MVETMMQRLTYVILSIFLAIIMANNTYELVQRVRPPVIMTFSGTENPVVKPGGMLRLIYEYDHVRFCETTLMRFIVRAGTVPEIMWRERVPGAATGLGHQRVLNSVRIPSDFPEGNYLFRMFTSSNCGSAFFQGKADDVAFEVKKN